MEKISKPDMAVDGAEHKHLAEVLRAKAGERIVLCPNDGKDYVYEITAVEKRRTVLGYVSETVNDTEAKLDLTVFFALLKGDKSELVVTKLTELGVKRIVPFVSEHTVKKGEKTDRLKRAAVEACKQCGRAVIPEVCEIIKFSDLCAMLDGYDKVVFAYEGAFAAGARLREIIDGTEKSVALIVGAEGGFAPHEVETISAKGVRAVTLGKRILRAETASIAAAAVILSLCGEWE